MSYNTFILLPAASGASLIRAHDTLQRSGAFSKQTLKLESDQIVIDLVGWRLSIHLASGAHVLEESREIVQNHGASRSDQTILASCDTRFELDGDADSDMEHFNDYVLAIEKLIETFRGVAFECHTEEFL